MITVKQIIREELERVARIDDEGRPIGHDYCHVLAAVRMRRRTERLESSEKSEQAGTQQLRWYMKMARAGALDWNLPYSRPRANWRDAGLCSNTGSRLET